MADVVLYVAMSGVPSATLLIFVHCTHDSTHVHLVMADLPALVVTAVVQTPVRDRLAAIPHAVGSDGPSAAVSSSDAAQLVDAAIGGGAASADAWAAITAVCAVGDVHTTATRLLSANVLAGAATVTLTRASIEDDTDIVVASRCLQAVASVCGAAMFDAGFELGSRPRSKKAGAVLSPQSLTTLCGGIVAAVVAVMQRLRWRGDGDGDDNGDAHVARLGCIALWRLARLDGTQQDAIGAAGGVDAVLSSMQRHVDSVAVQESGCGALWHLVHRHIANATAMVCGGGLGVVLRAMRLYRESVAVQECGAVALQCLMGCLDVLGAESAPCALPASAVGVEDVLTTMQGHGHSSTVQQVCCCGLLALAACNAANVPLIVARGGVEAVVTAMRRHGDCVQTLRRGCAVLHSVAAVSTENASVVATAGGVEVVLAAMRRFGKSLPLHVSGSGVLQSVLPLSLPRCGGAFVSAGGVTAVVSSMRRHIDSLSVQERGCDVLQMVFYTDTGDGECDVVPSDVCFGVIQVVVSAMRRHVKSVTVQECGCRVLRSIACRGDSYSAAVCTTDCIDAVVAAMRLLDHSTVVQECGCHVLPVGRVALAGVRRGKSNKRALKHMGRLAVGDVVVSAMRHRIECPAVQISGCAALQGVGERKCMTGPPSVRAARMVVDAMRRFGDDADVQRAGSGALSKLIPACSRFGSGGIVAKAVINDALEAVLSAMRRHAVVAGVQVRGLYALDVLSSARSGIGKVSDDTAAFILSTMRRHFDVAAVQVAGCCVLFLGAGDMATRTKGFIDVLLSAMRHHRDSLPVLGACVSLLHFIVAIGSTKTAFVAAGGIDVVLASMRRRPRLVSHYHGWTLLQDIIRDNPANGRAVIAAGGVEVVLSAMGCSDDVGVGNSVELDDSCAPSVFRMYSSSELDVGGCGLLWQLATQHAVEFCDAFAAAGGISPMLAAMRRAGGKASAQCADCVIITKLARGSATIAEAVVAADGVDVVVTALQRHMPTHRDERVSDVQVAACEALAALFARDSVRQSVSHGVADRCIDAVCAAMSRPIPKRHVVFCRMRSDREVAVNVTGDIDEFGCAALWHLAAAGVVNASAITAVGGVRCAVNAMRRHRSAASVQTSGCGVLGCLARDADGEVIVSAGGADDVLTAMLQHAGNVSVVQQGCAALGRLAPFLPDGARARMSASTASALAAVVAAARRHADSVGVQASACCALASLANSGMQCTSAIVAGGVVELVLGALRRYPESDGVQQGGCEFLGVVSVNGCVSEATIMDTGYTDIVLTAMRRFSDSPGVQQACCMALRDIACVGDAIRAAVLVAGGLEAVVSAMQRHADSDVVQASGCCAVGFLAVDVPDKVTIIELVLAGMRRHSSSRTCNIGRFGCEALVSLAVDDSTQDAIVAGGGVDIVVSLMAHHRIDDGCQRRACGALHILARAALSDTGTVPRVNSPGPGMVRAVLSAMRRRIHAVSEDVRGACDALTSMVKHCSTGVCAAAVIGADGVGVVLSAMRWLRDSIQVQLAGCRWLDAFASANDDNARAVVAAGGEGVVTSAMGRHDESGELQALGTGVRTTLVNGNMGGVSATAGGGIDRVLGSMRQQPGSVTVQQKGLGTLHHICIGSVDSVVAAGGIDVVLSAMRRHVNSAVVQARGCNVLRSLARCSDITVKPMIVGAGGIDVVVSAMRHHAACVEVQEHGCAALCSFTDGTSRGRIKALGAAGSVDVVTAAMARHSDSAAVQRHGCDAIRLLAARDTSRVAIVAADGVSLVVSAMRRHAQAMSMVHMWSDGDGYTELGEAALTALVGPRRAVSGAALCCRCG